MCSNPVIRGEPIAKLILVNSLKITTRYILTVQRAGIFRDRKTLDTSFKVLITVGSRSWAETAETRTYAILSFISTGELEVLSNS